MKVINNTSFTVVAFCSHAEVGYGDDKTIKPGEAADVSGPYLGEMGGGDCYVHLEGEIICQETPDDKKGLQIAKGAPICLQSDDKGITIRHYEDDAEEYVLEWRACNRC